MVMPSRTVGHARSTLREPPGALLPCLVLSALALRLADGGTVPQHFAAAARGAVVRRLSLRGGGESTEKEGIQAWPTTPPLPRASLQISLSCHISPPPLRFCIPLL